MISRGKLENLIFYNALVLFAVLFAIGLNLPRSETMISSLLVVSSGFFAYSVLVTWRFYSGAIGKMYKALLVASLCLFVIEVSLLVGFLYSTPIEAMFMFLAPVNVVFGVSLLLGLKYIYDFWIKPLEADGGFHKAVAASVAISAIVAIAVLSIGKTDLLTLRYLVFLSYSLIILAIIYYFASRLKGGRIGFSWKCLLIAIALYTVRNIILQILAITGVPYTAALPVEILAIYSYLCAGYGMLKQRF